MHLHGVEFANYKCFHEPTTILLDPSMTGIALSGPRRFITAWMVTPRPLGADASAAMSTPRSFTITSKDP